ncbi:outer membrane beta-barrel protein [uncultured Shewanella sp.]|uniref:outer membrane beta-barrel protein n=1 Tax=uncultured Shewanella sp. TaxID=173975 RepID=UPI0026260834|nr:outer membrane beta-barrel protein [uncultured Shewanella sp.]
MKIVFLLILLAFSSKVIAADVSDTAAANKSPVTGFYIGGDIGTTHLNIDYVDDIGSALSLGFYGGYRFSEWLGLEGHLYASGDHSDVASLDVYGTLKIPSYFYSK